MSAQWQQVKEIFQSALECSPDERKQFLDKVCGDDESLRREVETLLAYSENVGSFLEQPAIGEVAEMFVSEDKNFQIGERLSHFKIIEMLGAGGMGNVYLAEDLRLHRRVALKVLPETIAADKDYLRRFQQEALAASALNHPNILTIYEIVESKGLRIIASEYVKGETLRRTINNLSVLETLDIAVQIAAALEAAHRSGIVHRDIKPENIMRREDGIIKVLDFGLAKKSEPNASTGGFVVEAEAETYALVKTKSGLIMGTTAYMSPEQARGKAVDARTDIFSFGVVLYEMLSGKTPFAGETTSDVIAAILKSEPAPLDENTPAALNHIVRKALQKNRDERYQTVKDFLLDLKTLKHELEFAQETKRRTVPSFNRTKADEQADVITPKSGNGLASQKDATSVHLEIPIIDNRSVLNTVSIIMARWWRSNRKVIAACALLVALAGVLVIWKVISQNRNQASSNSLDSLRIKPLLSWDQEAGEGEIGARFSPNGTMIAYSLTKNGQRNIWTKQVPDGKLNPITDGKWNYFNPIWSPDGQRIAFLSNRDNQVAIWAMPFSGGELTPIKAIESDKINLLHWSKNGATIYYQQSFNQQGYNLFALDIASKQVTQITNFDSTNRAQFFSISPNEDRIAYSTGPNERLHIFVMSVGDGQPVQVTDDEASDEYPFWLPDGERIIYSSKRNGIFQTCIAYLNERKTEQINLGINDTLIRDVTSDGSKMLFDQSREESDLWQVRIDDKSETQITSDFGLELWSDVSPDSKNIVFQATTESKHLLEGSILIRSIDDQQQINIASNGFSPTFSPDGRKVAFLRYAGNLINLWIADKNGVDERQLTTEEILFNGFSLVPYNRVQVKDYSWSPDGGNLIYCAKKDGLWNVWQVAADGANAPRQISNNIDDNVRFSCPLFAPDGKHIAYTSSTIKPFSNAKTTTNLCLLNGENTEIVFSSESVYKLIGWGQTGNNLVIAMPEDKSTAKPTKVTLRLISTENNQADLASIEAAYYNNIQLSPDGRRIAYAAREDGKDNIRIISIAGGENAKITTNVDPTVYVSSIAWSPDSKAVYYGKQKQVGTITMIENFK